MDTFKIQSLIAQKKIVASTQIDLNNSYLQIGVYQRGNRKSGAADANTYAPYAIPLSEIIGTGVATSGQYRISQFPETIIPKTDFNESTIGKVFDLGSPASFQSQFFDYLNNGNIIEVIYCVSRLQNGIFIFEADDLEGNYPSGNNRYWIAYRQDPNNAKRLVKVGECYMTDQFYGNQYNYDWTAKDSGPNSVKFVYCNYPISDTTLLKSWVTKVTWTGSALVAEDTVFDYGGATVLSLYNDLTGYNLQPGDAGWNYRQPEWILDDDYYGMAMGKEKGWYWYRNVNGGGDSPAPDGIWTLVGFNILTGATKVTYTNNTVLSSISNITFDPTVLFLVQLIGDWYNHPDGITLTLFNGYSCDEGDNYNGVTALWSPYWADATKCIYVTLRDSTSGFRLAQNADINKVPYYWDNKSWYFFSPNSPFAFSDNVWKVHKYHVDTKQTTVYTVPLVAPILEGNISINAAPSLWPNNDGLFIYYATAPTSKPSWGQNSWQYLKHADKNVYGFHFDFSYPSHAFGDQTSDTNTMATYNNDTLGIPISTYKNMTF